jgi:hypothetical protein
MARAVKTGVREVTTETADRFAMRLALGLVARELGCLGIAASTGDVVVGGRHASTEGDAAIVGGVETPGA